MNTTPLLEICEQGHAGIATFLLTAKASPTMPPLLWSGGAEPQLSKAIEHGHVAIIQLLTKALKAPLKQHPSSNNALCIAIQCDSYSIATILLEAKACPNTASLNKVPALTLAMQSKYFPIARLLLEHNANPDFLYPHSNKNKLSAAIEDQNFLITETLLVNHRNIPLSHPLYTAISAKQHEVTCMLLRMKANPNEAFDFPATGQYPLLVATELGYIPLISALLKYSANPNVSDRHGWTPLHTATYQGEKESVKLLLAHKAQLHPTVQSMAVTKGHRDILALFESCPTYKQPTYSNATQTPCITMQDTQTQTPERQHGLQNTATQTLDLLPTLRADKPDETNYQTSNPHHASPTNSTDAAARRYPGYFSHSNPTVCLSNTH